MLRLASARRPESASPFLHWTFCLPFIGVLYPATKGTFTGLATRAVTVLEAGRNQGAFRFTDTATIHEISTALNSHSSAQVNLSHIIDCSS